MPFAAALFDLDGTLLDTIADLADSVNAMRLEMDRLPLPRAVVATYVGKGTRNLVVRSLSDMSGPTPEPARVEHGLNLFKRHYLRLNGNKATLYPGALEGLQAFRQQNMKMAIVTNKSTEFTQPLLERMGIASFFDSVVCGDTCTEHKPHPMPLLHACALLQVDPSQALMIGDSVNDTLAAQAANVAVLVVPYGYNEGQDVRTLQVNAIVTSIEEAAQWAARH
jgi:phosphoglycolate phosphatase